MIVLNRVSRKTAVALSFGVVCFLLSSCIASKNPLSDPDRAAIDPNLLGTWIKRSPDGSTEVLVVGRYGKQEFGAPGGIMMAAQVNISPEGVLGSTSEQPFFVSRLGRAMYMNRFDKPIHYVDGKPIPWDSNRIPQFEFVKYVVQGDSLDVWHGSMEELAKVIDRSVLRGTVGRSDKGVVTTAKLEDSTQNLAPFFSGRGADSLFPEHTRRTYQRLAR